MADNCEHYTNSNACNRDAGGCQWNPVIDIVRLDQYNTNPRNEVSQSFRKHAALMRRSAMKVDDQKTQRALHGGGSVQEKCAGKTPAFGIEASSAFSGVHSDFQARVLKNTYAKYFGNEAFDRNSNSIKGTLAKC